MAIPFPVFRAFGFALLLCAGPGIAGAETATGRMRVSAEVVVSCRFEASVPRMGSPDRTRGAASFSLKCTRGAAAVAAACGGACAPVPSADAPRYEYRFAQASAGGSAVATLLF